MRANLDPDIPCQQPAEGGIGVHVNMHMGDGPFIRHFLTGIIWKYVSIYSAAVLS